MSRMLAALLSLSALLCGVIAVMSALDNHADAVPFLVGGYLLAGLSIFVVKRL